MWYGTVTTDSILAPFLRASAAQQKVRPLGQEMILSDEAIFCACDCTIVSNES